MNARAAYAALSSVVPSQPQAVNPSSRGVIYPPSNIRSIDASEIELKEVHGTDLDGDGEEEVDYDSELEYGDDDEDADEEIDEDDDPNNPRYEIDEADYRFTPSPEPEPRARKRSSDELEDELEEVLIENASDTPSFRRPDRREQGGTPPKRARIGDDGVTVHSAEEDHSGHEHLEETVTSRLQPTPISSPSRMRKRNSEELEDGDVAHSTLSNKRVKVDCKDPLVESPASIGYSSLDGEALPEEGNVEPEDTPYFPPGQRRVSKADIDTLIALEDANEGGT
jgi:hypothetical protein